MDNREMIVKYPSYNTGIQTTSLILLIVITIAIIIAVVFIVVVLNAVNQLITDVDALIIKVNRLLNGPFGN